MNPVYAKILGDLGTEIGEIALKAVSTTAVYAFDLLKKTISNAAASVSSFNQMAINTSRELGFGFKDSIAYTQTLIDRTRDLSMAYGVTADAISKIQDGLTKATGKAQILTNQQAELYTALYRRVGEELGNQYASTFVRSLGSSMTTAANMAIGAYTKATRVGLNAVDFSSKVAKNLELANKMTFADGVAGITRMTALSEKLGFNLSSIGGVVSNFTNFQDAISNSARLMALGGTAGIYGANPLTMMYESLNNVENLTERVTEMVKGYATFNAKTGMAELNGYNREMVVEIAKALGMDAGEAVAIAKNQAKASYMEYAIGGTLDMYKNKEFRDWIINKADYDEKTGKYTVQGANGSAYDISDASNMRNLEQMWRESTMSDRDAFLEGARSVVSVSERIEALQSVISSMLAERVLPILELIQEFLIKEGVNMASVIARGFTFLLNPGFWKNIFVDITKGFIGGIAAIAQQALMFMGGWATKLLLPIGGVMDMIGSFFGKDLGITQAIGKGMDGRYIFQKTMDWVDSWFDRDEGVDKAMAEWKKDAGKVYETFKDGYYDRFKQAVFDSNMSSDVYRQRINEIREPNTSNVYIGNEARAASNGYYGPGAPGDRNRASEGLGMPNNAVPSSSNCTMCGIIDAINTNSRMLADEIRKLGSGVRYEGVEKLAYTTPEGNSASREVYNASQEPETSQAGFGAANGIGLAVAAGSIFGARKVYNKISGLRAGGTTPMLPATATGQWSHWSGWTYDQNEKIIKDASGKPIKFKALKTANNGQVLSLQTDNGAKYKVEGTAVKVRGDDLKHNLNIFGDKDGAQGAASTATNAGNAGTAKPGLMRRMWTSAGANTRNVFGRIGPAGAIGLGIAGQVGNSVTDSLVENGTIDRGGFGHYLGNGLSSAAIGLSVGSMFGPVGAALGAAGGLAYGLYSAYSDAKEYKKKIKAAIADNDKFLSESSAGFLSPTGNITAREVGGPRSFVSSSGGGSRNNEIRVNDIKVDVNINGTLKLEGGGGILGSIDGQALMRNSSFISSITDIVRAEINKRMNGGTLGYDVSYRTGGINNATSWS